MLSLIFWLGVLFLIYLFTRRHKTEPNQTSRPDIQRDQMWQNYLVSYRDVVKTDKERRLMDILIEGKSAAEYLAGGTEARAIAQGANQSAELSQAALTPTAVPATVYQSKIAKVSQPLDNTILLLYFGAFLLVASVGLFVAIGGLGGLMRTIIVGITAAVLYFGGLWLFKTSKKLAQAGISFVGTGLIVAPLTGVAWYNLVSGQTNAGPIWLLTSVACIALYIHAFTKIKNGFIAYLIIGSFVSTIESAVLTINLPSYGYAWGLLVTALLLAINSRWRGQPTELNRAGDVSAQLLIPLSVIGSITLLPHYGSTQLAITLFLSGVYYALLASWQSEQRTSYSSAAQVSFIAAVVSAVFANQKTVLSAGLTLIGVTAMYGVVIILAKRSTLNGLNIVAIAAISSLISLPLSVTQAWPFVASLVVATGLGVILWQKLQSEEFLEAAAFLLIGLPFVIGQYAQQVELGSWSQLVLCAVSAGLLALLVVMSARQPSFRPYYNQAMPFYVLSAVLVLVPAAALSFGAFSVVTLLVIVSFAGFHHLTKDSNWLLCSSIIVLLPLADALFGPGVDNVRFSAAVGGALLWNSGVSLATREALVRWVVVGCLLITPFAIGGGGLGIHWGAAGYAWGYLVVMAACIAARAIARGKLLLSAKVPIAGYYAEASQAYVTGYTLAGIVAVAVSLADVHSQLVTTVVLGVIAGAVILVAKIERNSQLLVVLPLILQAMLFSGIRPDINNSGAIGVTALISVLAAAGSYLLVPFIATAKSSETALLARQISVASAYLGPLLVLSPARSSLLLPVSLFVAGLLTYDYNRSAKQEAKELSIAVCLVAIQWLVYLMGYTNVHVHTHMIALYLGGFAFWRSSLKDYQGSQNYVQALFFVVTVPLVLQSLAGASGGNYGLMLIAEQVGFMVIGASFGQRFLLRWGLWTALAAVLFQLRGLGWAFLSMLALIIIGTAVYRLQKHPPDNGTGN